MRSRDLSRLLSACRWEDGFNHWDDSREGIIYVMVVCRWSNELVVARTPHKRRIGVSGVDIHLMRNRLMWVVSSTSQSSRWWQDLLLLLLLLLLLFLLCEDLAKTRGGGGAVSHFHCHLAAPLWRKKNLFVLPLVLVISLLGVVVWAKPFELFALEVEEV